MFVFIVIFALLVLVLAATFLLRYIAQRPITPEGTYYFGGEPHQKESCYGKEGYVGKSEINCIQKPKTEGFLRSGASRGDDKCL